MASGNRPDYGSRGRAGRDGRELKCSSLRSGALTNPGIVLADGASTSVAGFSTTTKVVEMFRHPAWLKERLTTPGHGITFPPQILRQIHLHLSRSFEWHRIKVRVELGQEADPYFSTTQADL